MSYAALMHGRAVAAAFRAVAAVSLAASVGCAPPVSPVAPRAPSPRSPPAKSASDTSVPISPDGSAQPDRTGPAIVRAIARTDDRTSITTGLRDEVVLVPGGVVWTESAEIWVALGTDDAPRRLRVTVDPHSVVTDGEHLYWAGDEGNGGLALATGKTFDLPRFGEPSSTSFAHGDRLYAHTPSGFFRLDRTTTAPGPDMHVERLTARIDPTLKVLPGLTAGPGVVFARAVLSTGRGVEARILRVRATGHFDALAVPTLPAPGTWTVDGDGALLVLDVPRARVDRIGPGGTKRRPWRAVPRATQIQACGTDVFVLDEDGVVTHHGAAGGSGEAVADGFSGDGELRCGFGQVAWSPRDGALVLARAP